MCLEHTFHQVMSRSATLCALLILCSHGIYGCQVDLKLSFSHSSSWNMRLNLNVVPVFQTMSDPGLGIPALPRKPADVNNFCSGSCSLGPRYFSKLSGQQEIQSSISCCPWD